MRFARMKTFPRQRSTKVLDELIDAGTINVVKTPTGAEWLRFDALETNDDLLRRRHARWYRGYMERLQADLHGPEQEMWLAQVDLDRQNIIRALDWSLFDRFDPDLPLEMANACFRYWYVRSHFDEGHVYTLRCMNFMFSRQDMTALRLANHAGALLEARGDYERANVAYMQAGDLAKALHESLLEAAVLSNRSILMANLGERVEAMKLAREAVEMYRVHGTPVRLAGALINLAAVTISFNEVEGVEEALLEARKLAVEAGDPWFVLYADYNLAHLQRLTQGASSARELYIACLRGFFAFGDLKSMAEIVARLTDEEWAKGNSDKAVILAGGATRLRREAGAQPAQIDVDDWVLLLNRLRENLGEGPFDRLWGEAEKMSSAQIVEYASRLF